MGTTNLHALHLNGGAAPNKYGIIKKKDGQTCFACHLPHTAHQEKLLRTEYQCTGHFLLHDALCPEHQRGNLHRRLPQAEERTRGTGQDPNATAGRLSGGEAGRPLEARAARPAGSARTAPAAAGPLTNLDAPSRSEHPL